MESPSPRGAGRVCRLNRSAAFWPTPRMRALPLLLACTISLSACSDDADEAASEEGEMQGVAEIFRDSLAVTLDQERYVAGAVEGIHGIAINHRFTNRTTDTLYLVNCNGAFGVSLEREVDGEWQNAWSPPIPACLSSPIVIEPGGRHPGSLVVPVVAEADPVDGVVPGIYRLMWGSILPSWSDAGPLAEAIPVEERTSEPFEVAGTSNE